MKVDVMVGLEASIADVLSNRRCLFSKIPEYGQARWLLEH